MRKLRGITQAELAKVLEVKPQAISNWERGITTPKGKQLSSLSTFFDKPVSWLLYGEEDDSVSINTGCALVVEVPLYDQVNASAGNGYENYAELATSVYPVPKDVIDKLADKKDIVCIKAYGNSMAPAFYDGAILAINQKRKEVIDGRIYVFRVNARLRVKAIKETNKGLRLISYNPEYEEDFISWEALEHNSIEIIGEVFWFSSKINV